MKRLTIAALIVSMVMSLAACGATDNKYFVRESDGKFFTYEEFSKTYSGEDTSSEVDTQEALDIVYANTDHTEDDLVGVAMNEEDGDMFYNILFARNGSFVFFVRRKDGRFYAYEDFNKAYYEDYEGYTGHD